MNVFQLVEYTKDILAVLREHKLVVTTKVLPTCANTKWADVTTTEYSLEKKKHDPLTETAKTA